MKNITVDQLSAILFEIDPLNFAVDPDEYYSFADYALSENCTALNIVDSVNAALQSLSFEDDTLTEAQIAKLIAKTST